MKTFWEWYLNIDPSSPGQGTVWNYSHRSPWPDFVPAWAVLILSVSAVAFIVWVYLKETTKFGWPARVVLACLRLSVVGLVLFFLCELTLLIDRTSLPFVVILIDDSASMGIEDHYPNSKTQRIVKQIVSSTGLSSASRLNLVKSLLTRESGKFLNDLLSRHKLRVYRFSDVAVPLGQSEYLNEQEVQELLPLLSGLEPLGEETRPGPAIQKILDDFRGALPSAVVVFTDGITSTTSAENLSSGAKAAARQAIPLFVVGIGSDEPARDIHVHDLLGREVAFVNDPIVFSVKLKGYGYKGKMVSLNLKEFGSKEILSQQDVQIGDDGQNVKVEVTYSPSAAGEFDYVLEVDPLPNETNLENNSQRKRIRIKEEKLKVLLADAAPRYEFRYLKNLLDRDRTIEVKTVLQDADLDFASEDETALRNFPVKKADLFQYDVIILGDLNPALLNSSVFESLKEFVREKGGGLILVAGPEHNPVSYRGTALEALFPIEIAAKPTTANRNFISDGFRPNLTSAGRTATPLFRFAQNESDSIDVWNSLPEMFWFYESGSLKGGTIVFAQHPFRQAADHNFPIICMQRFGAGKVLFHATDELWRWRFRVGDLYYGRYWVQAIRYLSQTQFLGQDRSAELSVDRLIYRRGETVSFRVRFIDESKVPTNQESVEVVVESSGTPRKTVELTRVPQSLNIFEGQAVHRNEGNFHAWISQPSLSDTPPAVDYRVEVSERELQKRSLDLVDLTLAAKTSRGKFITLSEVEKIPQVIPAGHPVPLQSEDPIPLWNRWELFTLFLFLLTTEWLLRKRFRLV